MRLHNSIQLANVVQAMQAQASLREAEEARNLNMVILPFTIVTVIFVSITKINTRQRFAPFFSNEPNRPLYLFSQASSPSTRMLSHRMPMASCDYHHRGSYGGWVSLPNGEKKNRLPTFLALRGATLFF